MLPTPDILESDSFPAVISLQGGAGNVVPQYAGSNGRYQRIGNLCFVDLLFHGGVGNNGAGTGTLVVDLPLPASSEHPPDFILGGHLHNGGAEFLLYMDIAPGQSIARLFLQNVVTQTRATLGTDQSDPNRFIRLHTWYWV